jgi:hypothetical protein
LIQRIHAGSCLQGQGQSGCVGGWALGGGGVSGGTDARLLLVLPSITLVCVYPVRLMRGVVQTRGVGQEVGLEGRSRDGQGWPNAAVQAWCLCCMTQDAGVAQNASWLCERVGDAVSLMGVMSCVCGVAGSS